ncbi:YtxH domain-containing protein [Pedobacter nototheniae]|uniref:YtxH domain-containing protein n=1 Tax=Pedobacter nototheniae TaxID=2488994 RepID=UPI002930BA41|nr:YtxH domain-containing protein [Pedobacter nototheniae]
MNYRKMLTKHLIKRSNNNAQIAIALVAGLAAGAVISVLFAPDSGAGTRDKIADKAKDLKYNFQDRYEALRKKVFGVEAVEEDIVEQEIPHFKHNQKAKRKSDIKEVLEDVHENVQVQEGQG